MAIGAMAAMVAGAAFALDATVQAKSNLDVLNVNIPEKGDTAVKVLGYDGFNKDDTKVVFNLNGEKAGAAFRLRTSNVVEYGANDKGKILSGLFDDYNLWVQPADFIKIAFNTAKPESNQEHFTWWKYDVGDSDTNFNLVLTPIEGLSITAGVNANGYWFKDSKAGEVAAKVAYGADFGTVYGMYDYKGDTKTLAALGYNGAFGPVSLFADASLTIDDYEVDVVKGDLDVSFTQDALFIDFYTLYTCKDIKVEAKNELALLAKVQYDFGAAKAYVDFRDGNLMADKFTSEIRCGSTFNVGSAGFNTYVLVTTGAGTTISVPVEVTLSL